MTDKWFIRREMDMTSGSMVGNIVRFSLPLLFGNLFQQLYNMVDTWVIGQTGENGAYAAVGSVGPIINILIGFFLGLSSGAGVVISQYYGARREDKVHDAVHTALAMTGILAVLFTAVGVLTTPLLLRLMLGSETREAYPFAKTYLTIYFAGVGGLMVYNMSAGILRAVGDSNRPFYFLLVSAAINISLDLIFVFVCRMGVAGVALATVIAQFASAVLAVITLRRSTICIRLRWSDLRVHADMLRQILKVGIPAALQLAITAFSNVFVQAYIANVHGNQTYCLGGWTSYTKIDQFIFLPIQSLALAATTFVAQNLGMGDLKRAKRGARVTFLTALAVTVPIIALVMLFAPRLAAFFNPDPNVVAYATLLLRYLTPFYVLCCANQVYAASLRGAGDSRAPMIIMLSAFVAFRQLYLFVMTGYISNELLPVAFSYPAGWFVCCVTIMTYYHFTKFDKRRLIRHTS